MFSCFLHLIDTAGGRAGRHPKTAGNICPREGRGDGGGAAHGGRGEEKVCRKVSDPPLEYLWRAVVLMSNPVGECTWWRLMPRDDP